MPNNELFRDPTTTTCSRSAGALPTIRDSENTDCTHFEQKLLTRSPSLQPDVESKRCWCFGWTQRAEFRVVLQITGTWLTSTSISLHWPIANR
jgi:hypothetical protein